MNIFNDYQAKIFDAIAPLLPENTDLSRVSVESPRDASHGDLSTNAAMVLSKVAGTNPRALAETLKPALEKLEGVTGVEIAGPGFINIRLDPSVWHNLAKDILKFKDQYGQSDVGSGKRVNVEYVSVNPTGPMHAGHVRGAVIGNALVNVLNAAGFNAVGEYYFNDAGTQIDILAQTSFLRYREALGENIGDIPEGLYPGDYLKDVGQALKSEHGDKLLGMDEDTRYPIIKNFAVSFMMDRIRDDLALIDIKHDIFTNEREIIESGKLQAAFDELESQGLIYTGTLPPPRGKEMKEWKPEPLTLFRSSDFGDQQDRALKKRDGEWAYIMPDIAYHHDKISRGFLDMINVLGSDHGGYEEKMRPAIKALGGKTAHLDVIYNQMVKVLKNGVPVKLSKRAGNIITLRDMVNVAGAGVVRFFMLTRSPDSQLEFDYAKVVEQSADNPVFYVQYAHARCASVIRLATDMFRNDLDTDDLSALSDEAELAMIRQLSLWPRIIEQAAIAREPHRVAFYVMELAATFHALWNKGKENTHLRFLDEQDVAGSKARVALVRATKQTIANALAVMGVDPLDELRHSEKEPEEKGVA